MFTTLQKTPPKQKRDLHSTKAFKFSGKIYIQHCADGTYNVVEIADGTKTTYNLNVEEIQLYTERDLVDRDYNDHCFMIQPVAFSTIGISALAYAIGGFGIVSCSVMSFATIVLVAYSTELFYLHKNFIRLNKKFDKIKPISVIPTSHIDQEQ